MTRLIYAAIYNLLLPLILIRLFIRSMKNPGYKKRWLERFSFFRNPQFDKKSIWIHAVSVGESIATSQLVECIEQDYPNNPIIITTMTPTGSKQIVQMYGDRVFHVYAPYDSGFIVNRFLNKTNPSILIIMETELWPTIIHNCYLRKIPVVLTNARMSKKSVRGYSRLQPLIGSLIREISFISAQTRHDKTRLAYLGKKPELIEVNGNLKYDCVFSDKVIDAGKQLRLQWLLEIGMKTKVFSAISTHDGEEKIVLSAFQKIRDSFPDLLLMIVPRHPEHFQNVYDFVVSKGLNCIKRSERGFVSEHTQVVVADTMGEVPLLLSASDICFVGGSLINRGGHNILEPLALGVPVSTGQYMFNFKKITEVMVKKKVLTQVSDERELADWAINLLSNPKMLEDVANKGKMEVAKNRGAIDKQILVIKRYLLTC